VPVTQLSITGIKNPALKSIANTSIENIKPAIGALKIAAIADDIPAQIKSSLYLYE